MNEIERTKILNKIRLLENRLKMDPNNESLTNEINSLKKQLEENNDEVVIIEDYKQEEVLEKNQEELEKKVSENTQDTPKREIKKQTKEEKPKKKINKTLLCKRASVRNIPQPLMSTLRTKVKYASSNSDALICFLAYVFEDYSDLTDEQIAIAKSIDNIDPFADLNKRLNTIRNNSEDIKDDVKLLNVITTFLLLRSMGLDSRSFDSVNKMGDLLTKDIEDAIAKLEPSINDYLYRLNRRKNSDINLSKK